MTVSARALLSCGCSSVRAAFLRSRFGGTHRLGVLYVTGRLVVCDRSGGNGFR